jgi:hypothetical protein
MDLETYHMEKLGPEGASIVDQSHCRSAPSSTEQGHGGFVIRYTVHKTHSMTMLPIL